MLWSLLLLFLSVIPSGNLLFASCSNPCSMSPHFNSPHPRRYSSTHASTRDPGDPHAALKTPSPPSPRRSRTSPRPPQHLRPNYRPIPRDPIPPHHPRPLHQHPRLAPRLHHARLVRRRKIRHLGPLGPAIRHRRRRLVCPATCTSKAPLSTTTTASASAPNPKSAIRI